MSFESVLEGDGVLTCVSVNTSICSVLVGVSGGGGSSSSGRRIIFCFLSALFIRLLKVLGTMVVAVAAAAVAVVAVVVAVVVVAVGLELLTMEAGCIFTLTGLSLSFLGRFTVCTSFGSENSRFRLGDLVFCISEEIFLSIDGLFLAFTRTG